MIRSAAIRPTPEQLALLSPFERLSFEFVDFVNSRSWTKAASATFLRTVGMSWVYLCSRNLVHMVGFDRLRSCRPARGIVLASNHRSFFDLYVINCWLYRHTNLLQHTYFPVRSDFFYERPAGLAVNLAMSAAAMYPPIFRQPAKRGFNTYGVKRLVQLLQQPGAVVGVHPEGRRGKGPDPYALLPAQPGIGKLILEARPTVVPIFINGLGNDLLQQIRGNIDCTGDPIIIVAGEPLELSDFFARRKTLRTQKELADHVTEQIRLLGPQERELRQRLSSTPPLRGPVVHS